jgi:hypothetical protein
MSSENNTKKVRAVLLLEVLGRPVEHLKETLEKMIKEIGAEKGVTVLDKRINDPKELEERKEFFTTFAELEVEVEEILYLAILIFKYMPAHVEIMEPELVTLSNNDCNDLFNELARRLHGYDEVARVLQMQNKQIQEKAKKLGVDLEAPEGVPSEEGKDKE